ncbi:hypothetical protein ACPEEZ_10155 [Frigoribacterium sp. 2-23]|uniref:hypothetical protein n=1 Tax=Frigoribacterium sp. 2-23 TaxID=3415006 RepID=UPI003C6EFCDA
MTQAPDFDPAEATDRSARRRRPAPVWALVAIVTAEFLVLLAAVIFLVVELLIARPDSYASAVAVLVLTVIACAWVGAIVVGVLRGRAWSRAGAITWQVLQIAVGFGSFGGAFANIPLGWWLIAPAVLVIVLLFVPSVVAVTSARDEHGPRVF